MPSSSVWLGNSCSCLRSKYVTTAPDSKFLLFLCDEKQKMNAWKLYSTSHYKAKSLPIWFNLICLIWHRRGPGWLSHSSWTAPQLKVQGQDYNVAAILKICPEDSEREAQTWAWIVPSVHCLGSLFQRMMGMDEGGWGAFKGSLCHGPNPRFMDTMSGLQINVV